MTKGDHMPTSFSSTPEGEQRAAYIQSLRELAGWLADNPSAPIPSASNQQMSMPVMTNEAVEAFATEHHLPVAFDDDGNASCDVRFGPIAFHVYGYVDFTAHLAQMNERRAREWAEQQGLVIQSAPLAAVS
jgi:hypothetical protein